MLLAADFAWVHDAVVTTDPDFFSTVVSENVDGKEIQVLVLQGGAASLGIITVDTDLFGTAVDKVRISDFAQVTIEGHSSLARAVVWNVDTLVIEAPIQASLWVSDVAEVRFESPLPADVVIYGGQAIRVEAPSFANTRFFSDAASLTLVSGKAHDSLDFWTTNLKQTVVLSFTPDKLTLNLSAQQLGLGSNLFQVGDGTKLHLADEWIRSIPIEQFQAILTDLLANPESTVGHFGLVDPIGAKTVESLSLPPPSMDNLHTSSPKFALPEVFSSDLLGTPHSVAELNLILAPAAPAPVSPVSDLVVSFVVSEAVSAARMGPVTGAILPANMPGRISAPLFEPFRGLRDFIAQRITQEFVPGARAALLVEPRPAKPALEKRVAPVT